MNSRAGREVLAALDDARTEIREQLVRAGDDPADLTHVLEVSAPVLGFDRAALLAHQRGGDIAFVVAATDDPGSPEPRLVLDEYPEVRQALTSGEAVTIEDVKCHPLTQGMADDLLARGVGASLVIPCLWKGASRGALFLRKAEPGLDHLDEPRQRLARDIALLLAAWLHGSSAVEQLTESTRQISRATFEAHRRQSSVESLAGHFEATADGVVAVDQSGEILFVNRAAESLTGFAREALLGKPMVELVRPDQAEPLEQVLSSVMGGQNIEAFDLELSTTSTPILVSVTTSTVLAAEGAAILSFRDVTAQRALEDELKHTKDFLEKLIDSAVDAIIAADLQGRVLLFNSGAERVFGYRADEVKGSIPAWHLYPAGLAQQIMAMLRSPNHGGVGRLEQTRLEILTKRGEVVPVNLTASIIYEDGQEAATVGLITDLRDHLRMEAQLRHAQDQLEIQERQAMVAQLAGAAAHELNQPLTSILGYAQLIERQSDPDAPHTRALQVILTEVQRMAEIVRKIGRITRYEVKEYVGSASIMDLDRSAASSSEFPVVQEEEPGEITKVGTPAGLFGPDEQNGELEPADEEITSQHLILAKARDQDIPDDELPPLPNDADEAAPAREIASGKTSEASTNKIGPKDGSSFKP